MSVTCINADHEPPICTYLTNEDRSRPSITADEKDAPSCVSSPTCVLGSLENLGQVVPSVAH